METIFVEVISLIPGLYDTCFSCEYVTDQVGLKDKRDQNVLDGYPEDLKEDYLFLSHWIRELSEKYRERILIRVIDAQSLLGVYKSIRYGVRRYPTFVINKKSKYTGKEKGKLDALLAEYLGNRG